MSASPDPKVEIAELITAGCMPRNTAGLKKCLDQHGETRLDLHLFALEKALALNVTVLSKSHSDLLHTVLQCLLDNCRVFLATSAQSVSTVSTLVSEAMKMYDESEDEWRAKLHEPGQNLLGIINPTPGSAVCSSPMQSPASAPSGQPDSSCQPAGSTQQPPSHARLSAILSLSEPPPELLLRQTVPELEEVLSAANIDAADVNAIGDSLVGILALARAHCLSSHARKLAAPFGDGDVAELRLFHKAHGEEKPKQLSLDEPQLCTSIFKLFREYLAPVLEPSHALKGFTLFGCDAPPCTAVILRRYRSNCAGPPPSVCKLPRHRYREPRKNRSPESGNVAADALFLLVKTDGDKPCCVDCRVYDKNMFDAMVLKLEELSKNNDKLTSVFVLEAKAVVPTGDKMVPHINCIVDQGLSYWSNLKKKLKDKQPTLAKMLGETIPVLVGANFGAPQKDIEALPYDASRGREVKTAFGYVAQAAAVSEE